MNLPPKSSLLNLESVVQINILITNNIMLTNMFLHIPCNLPTSHELPDMSIKYCYLLFVLLIFFFLLFFIFTSFSFDLLHILVLLLLDFILNWFNYLLAHDLEYLVLDRWTLLKDRRVIDDLKTLLDNFQFA